MLGEASAPSAPGPPIRASCGARCAVWRACSQGDSATGRASACPPAEAPPAAGAEGPSGGSPSTRPTPPRARGPSAAGSSSLAEGTVLEETSAPSAPGPPILAAAMACKNAAGMSGAPGGVSGQAMVAFATSGASATSLSKPLLCHFLAPSASTVGVGSAPAVAPALPASAEPSGLVAGQFAERFRLREARATRAAFARLLSEEVQAERERCGRDVRAMSAPPSGASPVSLPATAESAPAPVKSSGYTGVNRCSCPEPEAATPDTS
mmetsp:Transcript_125588/g.391004  ORF Transcript_125588/g.391004 Transcript_125588/m.391004 type:complete len:266 (+) Transcript_125588:2567-3364(+)